MNFQEVLDFLYTRHATGMKLGLENIQSLVKDLNHPEREFKSLHIAGTNGKGSTASMLSSIFQAAGYKTGLYTSPHLIHIRERIQINGTLIPENRFVEYIEAHQSVIQKNKASYFEIMTLLAFLYFRDEKVDIAILETGLGGRLDATNVIHPELSLITDISFDHTKTLGKTLKQIAGEKAGIFKKRVPVVTGVQRPSIVDYLKNLADQKQAPFYSTKDWVHYKINKIDATGGYFNLKYAETIFDDLHLNLIGSHQIKNACTALLATQVLNQCGWHLSEKVIRSGLNKVNWPARLQLLPGMPKLLVDSAHNHAGVKHLVFSLKKIFQYKRLIFVFGVLKDKDYSAMLEMIASVSDCMIFTKPNNDRALDPRLLQQNQIVQHKQTEVHEYVKNAIERAYILADKDDLICAAGSIYFVGEVLEFYRQNKNPNFRTFSG